MFRSNLLAKQFQVLLLELADGHPPEVVDFGFECAIQICLPSQVVLTHNTMRAQVWRTIKFLCGLRLRLR